MCPATCMKSEAGDMGRIDIRIRRQSACAQYFWRIRVLRVMAFSAHTRDRCRRGCSMGVVPRRTDLDGGIPSQSGFALGAGREVGLSCQTQRLELERGRTVLLGCVARA